MTDELSVSVIGFDELRHGSQELLAKIEKRADTDLQDVARQRADMVRAVVPVLTGRLRASVAAGPAETGALVGIGDDETPYAGWIEFGGTRGRPYVPEGRYLYPIALAAGTVVERDLTSATKQEIARFTWPPPPPTT